MDDSEWLIDHFREILTIEYMSIDCLYYISFAEQMIQIWTNHNRKMSQSAFPALSAQFELASFANPLA